MNGHPFAHFISEQQACYQQVKVELTAGKKQSHWMWFIFPQLRGLGRSSMAERFALDSIEQAQQYTAALIVGQRLYECTQLTVEIQNRSVSEIFGYPDDLKFHSSMTLFALAVPENRIFNTALEKYFDGKKDTKTLALLRST